MGSPVNGWVRVQDVLQPDHVGLAGRIGVVVHAVIRSERDERAQAGHGLRLLDGQTAGSLPTAPVAGQQLAIMVARWTPDHLHDQPLAVELTQIESRTRDYFDRLFS